MRMKKNFILPCIDIETSQQDDNQSANGIVVVSIIGKSALNANGLKVKSLGRMFSSNEDRKSNCTIEGFYDEEKEIVYLHAHTLLDTDCFLDHYEEMLGKNKETDFLSLYDQIKSSFARILLILFHVSHIVILSHPGSTFDVNYIQYFKAVDTLRQKLISEISDVLKNIENISDEWISNGRMCTPRLIFYFEQTPKNVSNLKKLEHNIEDRIYQILKKTRIINNCTSLFAIPLNQEFVFMSTESPDDRLGNAVRSLIQSCQPGTMLHIDPPFCSQLDNGKSFPRFLQVHIQQAKEKGFDDIVTSMRSLSFQPCYFELPKLYLWTQACKAVYELITNDSDELVQSLCTDTRFSEQRCEKVFPMAIARYQEGLPSHYSRAVHETRLGIALNLFAAQARGPKFAEYRSKIVGNCNTYWENSRQLCESPSLTGNPCTLPKHDDEQEHNSGVRYIAACDCGRIQRSREDPYTTILANYVFFNQASKECACSGFDRIEFEIKNKELLELATENKQSEISPGMLTANSPSSFLPDFSSWSLVCLGPSSLYSHNLGLLEAHQPGFLNSTNYLLPWDVVVYSKPKPVISLDQQLDTQKFSLRQKRVRANNNRIPQFTVKVFIGIEYECPRGHRFMLAAPDRVLRATPGSIVKDTGHKIAESDMPLYYPCPCRPTKPLTAQLMRLHIVTPKAQVYVTVNPRIQPAVGAPIFVATKKGPTALTQSTYWVMRLPFIYSTEKENFTENHSGRLLQGVFAVNKIEQ